MEDNYSYYKIGFSRIKNKLEDIRETIFEGVTSRDNLYYKSSTAKTSEIIYEFLKTRMLLILAVFFFLF